MRYARTAMAAPATDTQKQTFLDALARTGIVADAMREAGIKTYNTPINWRQNDEEFAKGFDEAMREAADAVESEARRRAIEGVTRQKMLGSGDNAILIEEQQYSDTLLLALLKAKKPDEFADRSKTELSSPDGTMSPAAGDTQAAARIAAMLEEAKRRREADSDPLFE